MTEYRHPMRDLDIHVFQRTDPNGDGRNFIAKFYPYNISPIFAYGDTAEGAYSAADDFRNEAVEKNEAAYQTRMAALAKSRAARAAKEGAA